MSSRIRLGCWRILSICGRGTERSVGVGLGRGGGGVFSTRRIRPSKGRVDRVEAIRRERGGRGVPEGLETVGQDRGRSDKRRGLS